MNRGHGLSFCGLGSKVKLCCSARGFRQARSVAGIAHLLQGDRKTLAGFAAAVVTKKNGDTVGGRLTGDPKHPSYTATP